MERHKHEEARVSPLERRQPMTAHTFKTFAWPAGGWAIMVDGKLVRLLYATREEAENVARKLTKYSPTEVGYGIDGLSACLLYSDHSGVEGENNARTPLAVEGRDR
jgi:hypothetical protein